MNTTPSVEKPPGNALRKIKEQSLVRRRKISVPELGPMTTVQEVAMDSRKHSSPELVDPLKLNISSNHTWETAHSRTFY